MKNIFDELNSILSPKDVANILNHFGFDASERRNFRLRPDDVHPSAGIFIHNSGIPMIKDFGGGGFVGDVFKTLKEFAGVPYKESVDFVKKYLGYEIDSDFEFKLMKKYVQKFNIENYGKETLTSEEVEARWNKLYPLDTLPEKKKIESINKLVKYDYFANTEKKYQKEFLNRIRYSSFADDVAVKALRPDGKILAYKYRRWKTKDGDIIKWKALKGSEANKYSQIRILNPKEPVFIIEGYHDYINAVLTGINFIVIPYKSYKDFKPEELELLRGNKYYFFLFQDYDFDEKDLKKREQKVLDSKKQAENIKKALLPFAKENKIYIWNDIRKIFNDIPNIDKVKDFSDLIENFKWNSPSLFKEMLFNKARKTYIEEKKEQTLKKSLDREINS